MQGLKADKHLIEVLGLHQANLFARQLVEDFRESSLSIRQVDIRNLHRLIVPTARHGGRYKEVEVEIGGSSHKPSDIIDVEYHMTELTSWLNTSTAAPALIATVVHSWLTHIHPFEDGNGRMARLLANLILLKSSWPPLIVRSSDRLQYLDALSESDSGGNLLPLFELFVKSIGRNLTELEKPDLARRLFQADIETNSNARYRLWSQQLAMFVGALRRRLLPHEFRLGRLTVPDVSTFLTLEGKRSAEESWLAKLRHPDGRDLLLSLGRPSLTMREISPSVRLPPSLYLGAKDIHRHPRYSSYQTNCWDAGYGLVHIFDEISIVPQVADRCVWLRYEDSLLEQSIDEAATSCADQIGGAVP